MVAIRRFLTIEDPKHVILSDLPFLPGQTVEVVVIADDAARSLRVAELKALLKETQSLPQAQVLSDEDLAVEIAAVRAAR
jgi:hypothetical protein